MNEKLTPGGKRQVQQALFDLFELVEKRRKRRRAALAKAQSSQKKRAHNTNVQHISQSV